MIDISEKDAEILEVKIAKTFTRNDVNQLLPVLKKYLSKSAQPCLLLIIERFSGWAGETSFWEEVKAEIQYIGTFERIAVVGDKMWKEWSATLIYPLTADKIEFFPSAEISGARKWLNNIEMLSN